MVTWPNGVISVRVVVLTQHCSIPKPMKRLKSPSRFAVNAVCVSPVWSTPYSIVRNRVSGAAPPNEIAAELFASDDGLPKPWRPLWPGPKC